MSSELVRLAFQPTVLDKLPASERSIDVSFVGTLSADHENRGELLETVASRVDLQVWGRVDSPLPSGSLLERSHRGPAWGKEMYRILRQSRITLNYHIGLAQQYANNLRLFEATGVGALLLTDHKENLHEMFEPGKEVAVYNTPEECAEMSRYYLAHEREREAIARAGQQRTLRDHTYQLRIRELSLLFERYLRTPVAKVSLYR
jgi:spore maturation protein CgeB